MFVYAFIPLKRYLEATSKNPTASYKPPALLQYMDNQLSRAPRHTGMGARWAWMGKPSSITSRFPWPISLKPTSSGACCATVGSSTRQTHIPKPAEGLKTLAKGIIFQANVPGRLLIHGLQHRRDPRLLYCQ